MAKVFVSLGYNPIWCDFENLSGDEAIKKIKSRIEPCFVVIQLVGDRFGPESNATIDRTMGRISLAQYEARYAAKIGKRVVHIVLPESFPIDPCEAEPEDLRALQMAYREKLRPIARSYESVANDAKKDPVKPPASPGAAAAEDKNVKDIQQEAATLHDESRSLKLSDELAILREEYEREQARQEAERRKLVLAGSTILLVVMCVAGFWISQAYKRRQIEKAEQAEASLRPKPDPQKVLYLSSMEEQKNLLCDVIRAGSANNLLTGDLSPQQRFSLAVEDVARQKTKSSRELRLMIELYAERIEHDDTAAAFDKAAATLANYKFEDAAAQAGNVAALALSAFRNEAGVNSKAKESKEAARLLSIRASGIEGNAWAQAGQHEKAFNAFKTAMNMRDENAEPAEWATDTGICAAQLFRLARFKEAEPLMRKVLTIDERNLGKDHPVVARDLSNLGVLLKETGRLAEAEPLLRNALKVQTQTYGADHIIVAGANVLLAQLLNDLHRPAEAEPLMRKALASSESTFGIEHEQIAIRLTSLAQMLIAQKRFSDAEPLLLRALKINEKIFGPRHPAVARDLNNLSQMYWDTRRLSEAEPLMRRALEIDEKNFSLSHPDIARDMNNLALLLWDMQRRSEAEPLMRQAVAKAEISFGREHPKVASRMTNLALLLNELKLPEESESVMNRALEIDEKAYGPNHPTVAIDLANLARIYQQHNKMEPAESALKRALEIAKVSFAANHPEIPQRKIELGTLYFAQNRLDEAKSLYVDAMETLRRIYPDPDLAVASAASRLGQLYLAQFNYIEAEPLLREALEIRAAKRGLDHASTVQSAKLLMTFLRRTRRADEAEKIRLEYKIDQTTETTQPTTQSSTQSTTQPVIEP